MTEANKIIRKYNPELKLILSITGSKLWKHNNLVKKINLDNFFNLVCKHRINSQIYDKISKASINLSQEFVQKLESSQKINTRKSLLIFSELIKTGNLFNKHKIKWLTLKGPTLSYLLYNNINKRNYRDLDILIKPENLIHALELLRTYNYKQIKKTNIKKQIKTGHNIELINENNNVKLELHWKLFSNSYLCPKLNSDILNKHTAIQIQGHTLNIPKKEQNFVYILLHGTMHQWSELQWLLDMIKIDNLLNNSDKNKIIEKYNIKSIYKTYSNIKNILYSDSNKRLTTDKNTIACLKSLSDEKNLFTKLKKTNYLLRLSKSRNYKKNVILLRLKKII